MPRYFMIKPLPIKHWAVINIIINKKYGPGMIIEINNGLLNNNEEDFITTKELETCFRRLDAD